MKYEIIKGSEKDFEGAPEWCTHIIKSDASHKLAYEASDRAVKGNPWAWVGDGFITQRYDQFVYGRVFTEIIAERRPITEPELKPIYGDGIHDDTDALQQRIDMGIDIKTILNNGVFLTLKPLQFKPIPEPAWDGEGLPPVGVECEIKRVADWFPVTIKFISGYYTVILTRGGTEDSFQTSALQFRPIPIRSPEDAARDEAIEAMRDVGYTLPASIRFTTEEMAALYDAGYRKVDGLPFEVNTNITTDEMWREFEKRSDMEDVYKLIRERASRRGSF